MAVLPAAVAASGDLGIDQSGEECLTGKLLTECEIMGNKIPSLIFEARLETPPMNTARETNMRIPSHSKKVRLGIL